MCTPIVGFLYCKYTFPRQWFGSFDKIYNDITDIRTRRCIVIFVLVDDVQPIGYYFIRNILVITIINLDWQCNYGEQHVDRILAITSSLWNALLCTNMRTMLLQMVLLLLLLIVYPTIFFFNYFFIFILHYLFRNNNNNNNKCVLFCFVLFLFTLLHYSFMLCGDDNETIPPF